MHLGGVKHSIMVDSSPEHVNYAALVCHNMSDTSSKNVSPPSPPPQYQAVFNNQQHIQLYYLRKARHTQFIHRAFDLEISCQVTTVQLIPPILQMGKARHGEVELAWPRASNWPTAEPEVEHMPKS